MKPIPGLEHHVPNVYRRPVQTDEELLASIRAEMERLKGLLLELKVMDDVYAVRLAALKGGRK